MHTQTPASSTCCRLLDKTTMQANVCIVLVSDILSQLSRIRHAGARDSLCATMRKTHRAAHALPQPVRNEGSIKTTRRLTAIMSGTENKTDLQRSTLTQTLADVETEKRRKHVTSRRGRAAPM